MATAWRSSIAQSDASQNRKAILSDIVLDAGVSGAKPADLLGYFAPSTLAPLLRWSP